MPPTPPLPLVLSDHADPAVVAEIHDALRAFNVARSSDFVATDLLITARDDDGRLQGGLTGLTKWDWLYVDYLWVADSQRGSGLGSRLLTAAEAEARRRGCGWARLYTYDFQAPQFYEKHGYTCWGVLEDYPPGHRQIWYRKALT